MSRKSKFSTAARDRIEFNQLNEKAKNKAYINNKSTANQRINSLNTGLSLFTLIVAILIGIAVIRMLSGYSGMSFTTLLESLSKAPDIQMSLSSTMKSLTIKGEWAILDGLRRFINTLTSMFSVSLWCVTGLAQCIIYFAYFIGFIFIG